MSFVSNSTNDHKKLADSRNALFAASEMLSASRDTQLPAQKSAWNDRVATALPSRAFHRSAALQYPARDLTLHSLNQFASKSSSKYLTTGNFFFAEELHNRVDTRSDKCRRYATHLLSRDSGLNVRDGGYRHSTSMLYCFLCIIFLQAP